MKARIAKKIYKHIWLHTRCQCRQQALHYHGADPCCEEYGDKECRKCPFFNPRAGFLRYSKKQYTEAMRRFEGYVGEAVIFFAMDCININGE